jgi:hypothetical protein
MKAIIAGMAAFCATNVAAQAPTRTGAADPKNGTPPRVAYESAFRDYRPFVDPELARWREANQEMGRLNGHSGHAPTKRGSDTPAAPTPAAAGGHGGHGGHK